MPPRMAQGMLKWKAEGRHDVEEGTKEQGRGREGAERMYVGYVGAGGSRTISGSFQEESPVHAQVRHMGC